METIYSLSQLGWKGYFQHQLSLNDLENYTLGRVAVAERSELVLLTENGRLSLPITPSMPAITVGDWLLFDFDHHFVRLLERFSWLARKAAGRDSYRQLIAANLDTAFIVSSLNQDFNLNRIERYLALVHEAGIEPVVVLTKLDLCDRPEDFIDQVQALNSMLMIIAVNATDESSVAQLNQWIGLGNTVAFIGSSGVGKSTLINSALGDAIQQTSTIRDDDAKGRHTTTSRTLHLLDAGGVLLDTPGMRELQLADCEQGVSETFSDIVDLATDCKFSDCQHQSEPGCAVQAAVESGQLDERRLHNYQKLIKEQAFNTATLSERRAQDKDFGKMVKATMKIKQRKRH